MHVQKNLHTVEHRTDAFYKNQAPPSEIFLNSSDFLPFSWGMCLLPCCINLQFVSISSHKITVLITEQ